MGQIFPTELLVEIYPKSLVRDIGEVLLMKHHKGDEKLPLFVKTAAVLGLSLVVMPIFQIIILFRYWLLGWFLRQFCTYNCFFFTRSGLPYLYIQMVAMATKVLTFSENLL